MFAFKPLLKGLPGRDEIIHAVELKHMVKCFLNQDCNWVQGSTNKGWNHCNWCIVIFLPKCRAHHKAMYQSFLEGSEILLKSHFYWKYSGFEKYLDKKLSRQIILTFLFHFVILSIITKKVGKKVILTSF